MNNQHAAFNFRKVLALTLALILAFSGLVSLFSCEKEQPDPVNTDNTDSTSENVENTTSLDTLPVVPDDHKITLIAERNTDYKFIFAVDGTSYKSAVVDLTDAATKLTYPNKYLIPETDSAVAPEAAGECEILIGATNRPESAKAIEGLTAGDWTVRMAGKKLVINGKDVDGIREAINWFIEIFLEDAEELRLDEDFCYIRSKAPVLTEASQEELYYDLSTNSPKIGFTFAASDKSKVKLELAEVEGKDITAFVKEDKGIFNLSGVKFDDGFHTVRFTLSSDKGGVGYEKFTFGCGNCDNMQLYKGEVHAHTTDSDGTGTPREAYTYARDIAKLDFFAVTDHSNSYSVDKFRKEHIPLANEFNEPGKFVALIGYEQTYNIKTGYYGHLNTINSATYDTNGTPLLTYYKNMKKAGDAIVQFNHPGYSWGNFLEYADRTKGYDDVVNLYEFKGSGYDNEWALCLAKGWHVSPMHNEDNHSGQWGTVNEAVGYVLAPSLTRQNITEAMNMKRSYTTTDQSMKIYFSINDEWLGGTLNNPEKLNIHVKISTSKSGGLGTVSIVAEDNIIVDQCKPGTKKSIDWEITLDPEYDYYYVKVDGSAGFAVTAPVWIEGRDLLNITDMDRELVTYENNSKDDHRAVVKFKNNSDKAMTDVKVDFYVSALGGFNLETAKPAVTKEIGTLAAGAEGSAFGDFAYTASTPRITAIVSGKIDGKPYADTLYIQLTPILITEICCNANGYSYVEIYNATTETLNLADYSIRYWPKAGAKSDALAENTTKFDCTLKAHEAMVVWFRVDTAVTLEMFNSHYKTQLVLGQNVITISPSWNPPTSRGVQIEILKGSTVVTRTQYNFGPNAGDIAEDKSVEFSYQDAYTLTEKLTRTKQVPTPGTFDASLMPALVNAQ